MRAILNVGARHAGEWNFAMNTKTLTLIGILTTTLISASAIAASGWKIDEEADKSLIVFRH